MKNGVIQFPIELAALNINCAKFGLIFAFIKRGIIIGDINIHLLSNEGIISVINNVIIKNDKIKTTPVKLRFPTISTKLTHIISDI